MNVVSLISSFSPGVFEDCGIPGGSSKVSQRRLCSSEEDPVDKRGSPMGN